MHHLHTRIQGRDIMVDCRTCEHDEPRFEAARAILGSVAVRAGQ